MSSWPAWLCCPPGPPSAADGPAHAPAQQACKLSPALPDAGQDTRGGGLRGVGEGHPAQWLTPPPVEAFPLGGRCMRAEGVHQGYPAHWP